MFQNLITDFTIINNMYSTSNSFTAAWNAGYFFNPSSSAEVIDSKFSM